MKSTNRLVPVLAGLAALPFAASAAPTTFTFTASGFPFLNYNTTFAGEVMTYGMPITLSLSFDTDSVTGAADNDPSPTVGSYTVSGATMSLQIGFEAGAQTYDHTGSFNIDVFNNAYIDGTFTNADGILFYLPDVFSPRVGSYLSIRLESSDTSIFNNDSASNLFSIGGVFDQFPPSIGRTMSMSAGVLPPGGSITDGSLLAEITAVSIPEPSTFAALAGVTGLAVAALRRRRA